MWQTSIKQAYCSPTKSQNVGKVQKLVSDTTPNLDWNLGCVKSDVFLATTAPAGEPATNSANQGFQSYAGLKGNPSMEPGAISLKTASVVPGSAFNFGPSPTGIGLGTGLYGDKEGYSNFLDEFRGAPNYYMAAAAVHHRLVEFGKIWASWNCQLFITYP